MFSLNNLYPGISGNGKVEDITATDPATEPATKPATDPATKPATDPATKPENIPTNISKDTNANIMKEIISLDKKDENIDDTETLDNFFKDVQKISNPMEPIKEETKYTLFEDAITTE